MKDFLWTLSDGTDGALNDTNSTSKHSEHSHLYLLINKPTSAGLKCTPTHKRRRTVLPEPQLFTNQAEPSTSQLSSDQAEPPSKKVSPLRLQKQTGQSLWQVHCYILNLHSQVLLFNYPNLHFIYFTCTEYTIGCEHRVEPGFNNLCTIVFSSPTAYHKITVFLLRLTRKKNSYRKYIIVYLYYSFPFQFFSD